MTPLEAADLTAPMVRQPESWTYRALNPDWEWGLANQLMADQADSLRWLVWAKTEDGQKNRHLPAPITRPGTADWQDAGDRPKGMDVDELQALLARPRIQIEET